MYRIFDTTFSSDFQLPELLEIDSGTALFSVKTGSSEHYKSVTFQKSFEWKDRNGRTSCWCERCGEQYLFIFPGYAHYYISPDGVISCFMHENSNMQVMRHLLLNQIIPRYMASTGRLLLHASAVTLKNGKSVAFLGNSGFGKSTLTSSFYRNGASLISDDCILLSQIEDKTAAIGGFPCIRLFQDSMNAIFIDPDCFSSYTPYSDKQQIILEVAADSIQAEPYLLDALFFLNDPLENELEEAIRIEPLSGSAALIAMVNCSFSLDPSDQQLIARNFYHIGQSITGKLELYSLFYPRNHERLSEVREAIEVCQSI